MVVSLYSKAKKEEKEMSEATSSHVKEDAVVMQEDEWLVVKEDCQKASSLLVPSSSSDSPRTKTVMSGNGTGSDIAKSFEMVVDNLGEDQDDETSQDNITNGNNDYVDECFWNGVLDMAKWKSILLLVLVGSLVLVRPEGNYHKANTATKKSLYVQAPDLAITTALVTIQGNDSNAEEQKVENDGMSSLKRRIAELEVSNRHFRQRLSRMAVERNDWRAQAVRCQKDRHDEKENHHQTPMLPASPPKQRPLAFVSSAAASAVKAVAASSSSALSTFWNGSSLTAATSSSTSRRSHLWSSSSMSSSMSVSSVSTNTNNETDAIAGDSSSKLSMLASLAASSLMLPPSEDVQEDTAEASCHKSLIAVGSKAVMAAAGAN